MNHLNVREKRGACREFRRESVYWNSPLVSCTHRGWLLESSSQGLAFVTRSGHAPIEGMDIETIIQDSSVCPPAKRSAFVRRVNRLHADLFLIGAEYIHLGAAAQDPTRSEERCLAIE